MSHKQPLVLGTAGHIDHGKSTLIKALTGVDPDRLAEEKKRGITIELGFGEIVTPQGHHFGVVDVPGHEKFVRHMVAGATGIDAALIIIAADDGVMVQTREHLAILELLGVTNAIVVLTKIDKSEPDLIELVKLDVQETLASTVFADAPIVPVSSVTGEGIDALYVALDALAESIYTAQGKTKAQAMRLPVDRVFTIDGAGTVITGTLWEGSVPVGDEVEAVFAHKNLRVRSVQVHGASVEKAVAGQRVALNLVGASKDELDRGEMLATPGVIEPTQRFNAVFSYVGAEAFGGSNKAFKSGTKVHFHHSTRDTLAQIFLIEEKTLAPGQSALVQIRTNDPVALKVADRFIIRSFSPTLTIGGGETLLTQTPQRLKASLSELALLRSMAERNLKESVGNFVEQSAVPVTSEHVARALGSTKSEVAAFLNQGDFVNIKTKVAPHFVTRERDGKFADTLLSTVTRLHDERSAQHAFALSEVQTAMHLACSPEVFEAWVLHVLEKQPRLVLENGKIAHKDAHAQVAAQESQVIEQVMAALDKAQLTVPTRDELAQMLGVEANFLQRVLNTLTTEKKLIRLEQKFYFTPESIDQAQSLLEKAMADTSPDATMAAADLRSVLGVSRKYAIPLLEYFDAHGVTQRVGDGRYLV